MLLRALTTASITVTLLSLPPSAARACATCGGGDPTLTVMGSDVPFAARTRLSLDVSLRSDRLADGTQLGEGLLQLGVAHSPTDWLTLALVAPVVLRDLASADLTRATTIGVGQLDVRARFVVFRDRPFAPEHVLGVVVGVGLPTVVDQVTPNGQLLRADAQSGSATVDPIAGAFYTWLADPLSLFASATIRAPLAGRWAEVPGVTSSATVALQVRASWLTFRIALEGRLDTPSTDTGRAIPGSEHAVLFVSPDVLLAPIADLIFVIGLRMPAASYAPDGRMEGPYVHAGVVGDL